MLQAWLNGADVTQCHTLRRLICSGEALPPGLVKRSYALLPETVVYNLYGPTEAAIDVTCWTCAPDAGDETTPIGRPVANTEIVILDPQFRPVPVGVAGELAIGGVQLARGYHGRGGLSAEKFVPHPFSVHPGARLYRTGDLARYREDGVVEYLGRIDFQVKLHGFRIELGEIENALSRHPAVRESLVTLREDSSGAPQLVAYVTLRSDRPVNLPPPTLDEVRAFLQTSLPSTMIPSALIHLEAFPLSPNGKVERRLLPAPSGERPELRQSYAPPRSAAEQHIAAIWREVLGVDRVGVHDHFFDLGGNSIRVMQVHSRLSQAFEHSIPLVELFKYPTVAELARYLTQPAAAADTVSAARARAAERRAALGQRGQSRP
jgi:acyl-coenzyme A synthetase/AMP-(fatty) acid ligase/acyl carrier protein